MMKDVFIEKRRCLKEKLEKAVGFSSDKFSGELFNALAVELFTYQYHYMEPYRNLCDYRGITPDTISNYQQVPPVPTTIFKQKRLFAGPDSDIAAVFSTSGTTDISNRGCSYFSQDGLDLMKRSILVNAGGMMFPDVGKITIFTLAPSPGIASYMIRSWGMSRLMEHFGLDNSGFFINKEGLDLSMLERRLREAEESKEKVALIGASFGFVNILEGFKNKGISFRLPEGSRIMDAGGYKGRSRELSRQELESWFDEVLGIPSHYAVNLLGMTELASQVYDDTIASMIRGKRIQKLKQNPLWTRTRVVDPLTLEDMPYGEKGVLWHLDLANLDTPLCVLTDDSGIMYENGFEIQGRLSADQSRGCSLSIEEFARRKS